MKGRIFEQRLNDKVCWSLVICHDDECVGYSTNEHPNTWVQQILYLFPSLEIRGYPRLPGKVQSLGRTALNFEKIIRPFVLANL